MGVERVGVNVVAGGVESELCDLAGPLTGGRARRAARSCRRAMALFGSLWGVRPLMA